MRYTRPRTPPETLPQGPPLTLPLSVPLPGTSHGTAPRRRWVQEAAPVGAGDRAALTVSGAPRSGGDDARRPRPGADESADPLGTVMGDTVGQQAAAGGARPPAAPPTREQPQLSLETRQREQRSSGNLIGTVKQVNRQRPGGCRKWGTTKAEPLCLYILS